MPSEVIQSQYDELKKVADRFGRQAEAQKQMQQRIAKSMSALQSGWQGKGSAAFFAEMNGKVLPVMKRMESALLQAQRTTSEIQIIIKAADEDAAKPFKQGEQRSVQIGGSAANGKKSEGLWDKISNTVHTGLDFAGFIPGVGIAADGVNALIFLAEGKRLEAGISAVAMIPIFGDAAKAGKMAVKAGIEVLETGVERLAREGAETTLERGTKEGAETLAEKGAKQGDEFLRFGQLKPNTAYSRNGYEYATDELGRVQQATGNLRLEKAPRHAHQTEVGALGKQDDQGGHLIGSRFGGSSEGVNLVPQNANLNNGSWKQMENEWERALRDGKPVQVDIRMVYPPKSPRPRMFEVEYNIDGESFSKIFRNRPGG